MGENIPDRIMNQPQTANPFIWGPPLEIPGADSIDELNEQLRHGPQPHQVNPYAWLPDEDPEPKPAEQAQPSQEGEQ